MEAQHRISEQNPTKISFFTVNFVLIQEELGKVLVVLISLIFLQNRITKSHLFQTATQFFYYFNFKFLNKTRLV